MPNQFELWALAVLRRELDKMDEGEPEPDALTFNEWRAVFLLWSDGLTIADYPTTSHLRGLLQEADQC